MITGNPKVYITLTEAAKRVPYSADYLRLRINQGKLKAIKMGRNWVTTWEWLEEYVKSVEEYKNQIQQDKMGLKREKIGAEQIRAKEPKRISPPPNLPVERIWHKFPLRQIAFYFLRTFKMGLALILIGTLIFTIINLSQGQTSFQAFFKDFSFSKLNQFRDKILKEGFLSQTISEGFDVISNTWIEGKNILASLIFGKRLVQAPVPPAVPEEEVFITPTVEPYLTINAETAINATLRVKESIYAGDIYSPVFYLTQGGFTGTITPTVLTGDRTYTFPDLSGTVCLSTGNCLTITGGTADRLVKFRSPGEIADSSIQDLYEEGISLTIDSAGNVGIGIEEPAYALHVRGRIQATGDICTDLEGGRCLSEVTAKPQIIMMGGGGVGGAGTPDYLPLWRTAGSLTNSVLYQTDGNIGIGTTAPTAKLDVAGMVKMTGFQMPTGASPGYFLTSDAEGVGTWQPSPAALPPGTAGQTLRHDGTGWIANSFLFNNGTSIGIGTITPTQTLTVAGSGQFNGSLTISTTTLPQLLLQSADNYLSFSLSSTQAEMTASSTLIIDSLTGEIRFGPNVTLLNATSTEIRGSTFISAANDSTVRKSGELVFRGSIPIFRFSIPAQTTSTSFVRVSKYFSDPIDSLPPTLPGTTRVYAFLLNFADDIPSTASSSWRVYQPGLLQTFLTFEFAGQNLTSFVEGYPHLSDYYTLPDDDWQLEVAIPSGSTIRIFNIFLLAYDQL